uniref:Secreted protein n=1 Tax=Arundo donax TaxID=35708 RepID=A0A0A8ZAJ7_ARUDO
MASRRPMTWPRHRQWAVWWTCWCTLTATSTGRRSRAACLDHRLAAHPGRFPFASDSTGRPEWWMVGRRHTLLPALLPAGG